MSEVELKHWITQLETRIAFLEKKLDEALTEIKKLEIRIVYFEAKDINEVSSEQE